MSYRLRSFELSAFLLLVVVDALRAAREVPHALAPSELLTVAQRLRKLVVQRFRQEQREKTSANSQHAQNDQRKFLRDVREVNDERREDAGHVAHDVNEGNALRPNDRRQQLGGVLKSDVVRDVHAEATQNGQSGRVNSDRDANCEQAEDAAHHHRAEREPSTAPSVQRQRKQSVGWKFCRCRNCECDEEIQAQRSNISHVTVEDEGNRHPDENQQNRDFP